MSSTQQTLKALADDLSTDADLLANMLQPSTKKDFIARQLQPFEPGEPYAYVPASAKREAADLAEKDYALLAGRSLTRASAKLARLEEAIQAAKTVAQRVPDPVDLVLGHKPNASLEARLQAGVLRRLIAADLRAEAASWTPAEALARYEAARTASHTDHPDKRMEAAATMALVEGRNGTPPWRAGGDQSADARATQALTRAVRARLEAAIPDFVREHAQQAAAVRKTIAIARQVGYHEDPTMQVEGA